MTFAELSARAELYECLACRQTFQFQDICWLPFCINPSESLGDVVHCPASDTKELMRGGTQVPRGTLPACPRCGTIHLSGFTLGTQPAMLPDHSLRPVEV